MATTYWDYIRVEDLLRLQNGLAQDDSSLSSDEVLFITVHQIHELWFKLVLRELDGAAALFRRDRVPETALAAAARGLDRTALILTLAANHFSLIESMTTRDYLDFRDKLTPASGFQSAQFREIEILMGLPEAQRIPFQSDGDYLRVLRAPDGGESPALRRVRRRLDAGISLRGSIEQWLFRTPIDGSQPGSPGDEDAVREFLERFLECHRQDLEDSTSQSLAHASSEADQRRLRQLFESERAQARDFFLHPDAATRRIRAAILFIESYRELPLLAWPREILDRVIKMEQAYLIFRQRHARMVERMIGRRVGTGGSDGVAYLDRTAIEYRVFPAFWQVRTFLLRKSRIPALRNAERYQFRDADAG